MTRPSWCKPLPADCPKTLGKPVNVLQNVDHDRGITASDPSFSPPPSLLEQLVGGHKAGVFDYRHLETFVCFQDLLGCWSSFFPDVPRNRGRPSRPLDPGDDQRAKRRILWSFQATWGSAASDVRATIWSSVSAMARIAYLLRLCRRPDGFVDARHGNGVLVAAIFVQQHGGIGIPGQVFRK